MHSRTSTVTTSVRQERLNWAAMAPRCAEPQVFTFEPASAQAAAAAAARSFVPVRPKKRCTRVMYPAKVHMHLPPPEKNRAKRWLLVLSLLLLWQVCTEEPCAETPLAAADDCGGFALKPAEERADVGAGVQVLPGSASGSPGEQVAPSVGCSEPETADSGAGKSVVALLMYHRLGSDS